MKRLAKLGHLAVTAVIVVTATAACGSDPAPSGSSAAAKETPAPTSESGGTEAPSDEAGEGADGSSSGTATSVVLRIKDFAYEGPGKVAPGTEITVVNDDTAAHTVTAKDKGGFDVALPPGKSATFKAPSAPGSYDYICIYHANMRGTLTVG